MPKLEAIWFWGLEIFCGLYIAFAVCILIKLVAAHFSKNRGC